jgi:hypothetical protein
MPDQQRTCDMCGLVHFTHNSSLTCAPFVKNPVVDQRSGVSVIIAAPGNAS